MLMQNLEEQDQKTKELLNSIEIRKRNVGHLDQKLAEARNKTEHLKSHFEEVSGNVMRLDQTYSSMKLHCANEEAAQREVYLALVHAERQATENQLEKNAESKVYTQRMFSLLESYKKMRSTLKGDTC